MTDVVVFAAPGRNEAHRSCFASIEGSDIGKGYKLSMHPPELSKDEHWRATHELAARASSEFVLVLEDDAIVNRHILWNIETWRWKHHRDFGAGWVYNPGGYSQVDTWYRGNRAWAMTVAVLYRTETLPRLIDTSWKRMVTGEPWDCAIAWAAHDGGKRIRVHFPSLAEHQNHLPSKIGNPSQSPMRTSRGTFRQDWRRAERSEHGKLDRHGRTQI